MRCPEALAKLGALAATTYGEEVKAGKVLFAAVNIDDKAKGAAMAAER